MSLASMTEEPIESEKPLLTAEVLLRSETLKEKEKETYPYSNMNRS
jgi:hypothetical protein